MKKKLFATIIFAVSLSGCQLVAYVLNSLPKDTYGWQSELLPLGSSSARGTITIESTNRTDGGRLVVEISNLDRFEEYALEFRRDGDCSASNTSKPIPPVAGYTAGDSLHISALDTLKTGIMGGLSAQFDVKAVLAPGSVVMLSKVRSSSASVVELVLCGKMKYGVVKEGFHFGA